MFSLNFTKKFFCGVIIFCVAVSSGCGGAVVKSVGKSVVRTISKTPKFVKGEFIGKSADVAIDKVLNTEKGNNLAKPTQIQSNSNTAAKVAAVTGGAVVANELLSEDRRWIKDLNKGAYIWNPEPQEGESVRWNGNVVREGNNLYAQGHGTLEWYMDGKIFETEEGTFERGKQDGRFVHISTSGERFYSNWDNGEPISVESPPIQGTLSAKDLSLGELSIDDRADKVTSKLGKAISSSTDSEGGNRLKYKDAEVVIRNGKVSALVSLSSNFATARGIREGSSIQEVLDKYGTGNMKTALGEQTLYEYPITSADGHPCLLRFAVNNSTGKVDYISERFVQTEPQRNEPTNNATTTANVDSDAKQTFINYHKAITNRNYREAYETLSYAQRDRMGSFDSYVSGFADTISSEVTELRQVSSDADSCTFDYTLTARDRVQGNRVKVQTFKGQVTMAKDKGRWFIRRAESKKVNEKIE